MRTTPSLAEDQRFRVEADEAITANPPYSHEECDWGSDPMEILMAKQEREREELEEYLASPRH